MLGLIKTAEEPDGRYWYVAGVAMAGMFQSTTPGYFCSLCDEPPLIAIRKHELSSGKRFIVQFWKELSPEEIEFFKKEAET